MSVLVVAKFTGDTDKFRKSLANKADELVRTRDRAQAAGCIHHRFGVGDDGTVVVIDEWETATQFGKFMSSPETQALIEEMGSDGGPPQITITEAVASPDEF